MKIQIVTGEDWQGLYINNVLEDDGHSLSVNIVVKQIADYINQLGVEDGISCYFYEIDQEWMEEQGGLPQDFNDIPKDWLTLVVDVY